VADIRKSLGKIFLVLGIILTLAGGWVIFFSRFMAGWYTDPYPRVPYDNSLIVSIIILVIGLSILVVGIVLRILASRKG
jgi:uncharacterized membrane protein YidH (DUF202 family)